MRGTPWMWCDDMSDHISKWIKSTWSCPTPGNRSEAQSRSKASTNVSASSVKPTSTALPSTTCIKQHVTNVESSMWEHPGGPPLTDLTSTREASGWTTPEQPWANTLQNIATTPTTAQRRGKETTAHSPFPSLTHPFCLPSRSWSLPPSLSPTQLPVVSLLPMVPFVFVFLLKLNTFQ